MTPHSPIAGPELPQSITLQRDLAYRILTTLDITADDWERSGHDGFVTVAEEADELRKLMYPPITPPAQAQGEARDVS